MKRADLLACIAGIGFEAPDWVIEFGPPTMKGVLPKHRLCIRYAGDDPAFRATRIVILGNTPQELFNGVADRLWRGADFITISAARWRALALSAGKLTRTKYREAG